MITKNGSNNKKIMYNFVFGRQEDLNHDLPQINKLETRYQHTYIIGKTGSGKSTLLERMAEYDINQGLATIFIDPKGDSVKKLFELTEDKSRLIYISVESPVVINPINKDGYKLDNLIQEFIQILDVLITLTASNPESTVMMRMIIGYAMIIIKREKNKNIKYITDLLLHKDARTSLINDLIEGTDEWKFWKEFDYNQNWQIQESARRVAARLSEISTGEMKDFVVGKNELDISNIVNENKVVLVDTSRMNRNSRIYLSNLLVYSVLSYCEFAEKKESPLMVYVDEFQIVVSSLFSELLARSRSSKVGFTLAHQTFHQIPNNILSDIFGTVSTQICFRCGDLEAQRFAPIFDTTTKDIFNLDDYQAWLRIKNKNVLIKTYPPKLTSTPQIKIKPINEEVPFIYNFLGDSDSWIPL